MKKFSSSSIYSLRLEKHEISSSSNGNEISISDTTINTSNHDTKIKRRPISSIDALETTTIPNTVHETTSSSLPTTTPSIRSWMVLGPYDWSYCSNSQQVKPPRSHYDHVTKHLILNLDHYCPWMFNAGKL